MHKRIEVRRAYLRATATKNRLEKAIAEGATAKRIAELTTRLDAQRKIFHLLRSQDRVI